VGGKTQSIQLNYSNPAIDSMEWDQTSGGNFQKIPNFYGDSLDKKARPLILK
jgi:hypothetical protein